MQYKNQTIRSGYDEHVFVLKAMFYLLSPEETYYEFKEDVPDITGKVSTINEIEMNVLIVSW